MTIIKISFRKKKYFGPIIDITLLTKKEEQLMVCTTSSSVSKKISFYNLLHPMANSTSLQ